RRALEPSALRDVRLASEQACAIDVGNSAYYFVYMAETVRIEPDAHATLQEIARAEHLSLTEALSRAVAAYRRQLFLEGLDRDFAALRADKKAWADEIAEREAWDSTLADFGE